MLKWLARRRKLRKLKAMAPGDVFGSIYEKNKWRGKESRSGPGSDLNQTARLIETLPVFLRQHDVSNILDIPCGDFNWLQHADMEGIDYIGADIVPKIISENEKFIKDGVSFQVLDLIKDPLPRVDLILIRDCLVHFSFEHTHLAIQNLKKSGATWLLTTTFPDETENKDIITGQWRRINLEKSPYDLPAPTALLNEQFFPEDHKHRDKSLGLWRIADI